MANVGGTKWKKVERREEKDEKGQVVLPVGRGLNGLDEIWWVDLGWMG